VYNGPFSTLIHKTLFDLRLRWRFLRYTMKGIRVSYTEEHVNDGLPADDPDDSDDPQDPDDLDIF
jgi:hypothetical protein